MAGVSWMNETVSFGVEAYLAGVNPLTAEGVVVGTHDGDR